MSEKKSGESHPKQTASDKFEYRDWEIFVNYGSISVATDWAATHKDYDGAPDGNDDRYVWGFSVEDCAAQIDDWYSDQDDAAA